MSPHPEPRRRWSLELDGRSLRLSLLLAIAAVLIATSRPQLFAQHKVVKEQHDVYFLPPARQVVELSLGYKAAVADVLWAYVLVSQGLHTFQKRRFENLTRLYDVINELDPTWRTPYLLADALITFQAESTPYDEIVKARQILERGARHCPHDAEIWLTLGQFVSFLAPGTYLEDRPEEAERWRVEGARMLARAAELAAGDKSWVGWQAIGAAGILSQAGEREAAIRFYQRALAVTEDEEFRELVIKRLRALAGEKALAEHKRIGEAFQQRVQRHTPYIRGRTAALVLGPLPEPAGCAGPERDDAACASSWRDWSARRQPLSGAGDADEGR